MSISYDEPGRHRSVRMSSVTHASPNYVCELGGPFVADLREDEEVVRQAEVRDRRPEAPRRDVLVRQRVGEGPRGPASRRTRCWYFVQGSVNWSASSSARLVSGLGVRRPSGGASVEELVRFVRLAADRVVGGEPSYALVALASRLLQSRRASTATCVGSGLPSCVGPERDRRAVVRTPLRGSGASRRTTTAWKGRRGRGRPAESRGSVSVCVMRRAILDVRHQSLATALDAAIGAARASIRP